MKKISYETVRKQRDEWKSCYDDNNTRGQECIAFLHGEQWLPSTLSGRIQSDKENLTFNLCAKENKRMKAQNRELDFSLNISPVNKEIQEDIERTYAFKLILSHLMLNNGVKYKLQECLDKCIDYGYAFAEVNYDYENEFSLNSVPVLRMHDDPSIAFWDKRSQHPTYVDGRFCGMEKTISKDEVICKFEKYLKRNHLLSLKDNDNELLYYWFRDYYDSDYVLLKSGSYVREDMLTDQDRQNLEDKEGSQLAFDTLSDREKLAQKSPMPLLKSSEVCCVYFKVFLNGKALVEPIIFPLDDLPLPYHPGLTSWDPENYKKTEPLIYNLKDPQRFYNYIQSQIATLAKNSSGDKWIFNQDHVLTPTQINEATNINSMDGGFIFGGDIAQIRHERATELPMSMIQQGQIAKQQIDEISGAMINTQNSDQIAVSSLALKEVTNNITLLNTDLIALHLQFVNTIGCLYGQMIPRLYTEERTLIVKKPDGTGHAITINEDIGTGEIKNNIRDITNQYQWEISAGPSGEKEKENTAKFLLQYFQINPQAAQDMGDILMRNLASPDAGEMERRAQARIDSDLIAYSQGEITKEDYQMKQQEKQKQQMQMQAKMAEMSPEAQGMKASAAAESEKAKAMQISAQGKYAKDMADIQNDMKKQAQSEREGLLKIKLQYEQMVQDGKIAETDQAIEFLQKQLDVNQQITDRLNDAAEVESAKAN